MVATQDNWIHSDSNSFSFGVASGSIITASFSQFNQAFTAAGGSSSFQTLQFADTNGVRWTNTGGSIGVRDVNISLFAVSNTTQSSTGVQNITALSFGGAGAISVGITGNSVVVSAATQSNQSAGIYGSSQTTGASSSSTYDARSLTIVGQGANSIGWTNGSLIISAPNTIAQTAQTQSNVQGIIVSNTTYRTGDVSFSNLNNVTFGSNGANVVTASLAAYSLAFVNSNNITFGTSTAGSTTSVTASYAGPMISSYENAPGVFASQTLSADGASVSQAAAFFLPESGSFSFVRIPVLMTTNSTSRTITAQSLSASCALYSTWNAVVYKLNTGASSRSLTWVTSGGASWTQMQSVSFAADGTSGSYSQYVSGRVEGLGTSQTINYTVANANSMQFSSTGHCTNFSSVRYIDIDFAASLSAGPYWMIVGYSSSSATNSTGISAATNCNFRYSVFYANSQPALSFAVMGSTNQSTNGLGAGSFSTAGGGTTAALPVSALSSNASNCKLYFQLLRSA